MSKIASCLPKVYDSIPYCRVVLRQSCPVRDYISQHSLYLGKTCDWIQGNNVSKNHICHFQAWPIKPCKSLSFLFLHLSADYQCLGKPRNHMFWRQESFQQPWCMKCWTKSKGWTLCFWLADFYCFKPLRFWSMSVIAANITWNNKIMNPYERLSFNLLLR